MKACFKCGITKPLSDFYKHSRMADGHLNKCKECAKSDVHQHRYGAARDRVLAYDRARAATEVRKENAKRVYARWKAEHPDRRNAQAILGNAVRAGRVTPWPVCALPECNDKPEAHHADYDQPLLVVWLCSAHHKQAHALMRHYKEAA